VGCNTIEECAPGYACCEGVRGAYAFCRAKGLASKCVQFDKISTVVDRFDGDAGQSPSAELWSKYGLGESTIVDNSLEIGAGTQINQNGDRFHAAGLIGRRSLKQDSCSVEFADVSQVKGAGNYAAAEFVLFGSKSWERYAVYVGDGELKAHVSQPDGTGVRDIAEFKPETMRFVKIQENAGLIVFSSSGDGKTYNVFYQEKVPAGANPSDVGLFLGLYINKPKADAGPSIRYDNLNVVP
jgi:hypothetical protein